MNAPLPSSMIISPPVAQALKLHQPIVSLETALLTHGLPHPENVELALTLEDIIRGQGAIPATIGVLDGKVHIGLTVAEIQRLGSPQASYRKISRRDFGIALALQQNGGTTVAGTLIAAHTAGIQVFATGGIGGVHRQSAWDISADLPELGRTPMIVVCAGAKAILDLPATLEYLETLGVPVIGYQTEEFPAFYSRQSGLPVNASVSSPAEVCRIARSQWNLGMKQAVVIVVPPPTEAAMPFDQVEQMIQQALRESQILGIRGAALTPFMLNKINELSAGASLRVNLALLKNNARLAAQIAQELSAGRAGLHI